MTSFCRRLKLALLGWAFLGLAAAVPCSAQTISGCVLLDSACDGSFQEDQDPGLEGITVELRDASNGQLLETTVTVNPGLHHPGDPPVGAWGFWDLDIVYPTIKVFTICGDSNSDGGVDISDSIHTLGYLFLGGPAPLCYDAADVNDDGALEMSDPVFSLTALYFGQGAIPQPYPLAGQDGDSRDVFRCDW